MIPMADNLNHSSFDVTYELINLSLHLEGHRNPPYYRYGKFLNDYHHVYEATGWTNEEIAKYKLNIHGRYDRKIY